jgi:hypothetical protein
VRDLRLTRPPHRLIRRGVKLDNVALVPASLLPFKTEWQAIANELPQGDILIVLPSQARQQRVARIVAARLSEKGKRVRVMDKASQRNAV